MRKKTYKENEHLQTLRNDFLNLAQCWVYCVLYYQQIYPPTAFEFRTVYGTLTPMTISVKVKTYIEQLFKEIEKSIWIVNYLEMELCEAGHPQMSFRFMMNFFESQYQMSRHQKESQYKHFIAEMVKGLKVVEMSGNNRTFNFYVQYRYDKSQRIKPGRLQDKWVKAENTEYHQQAEKVVGDSLKLEDMSIICIRRQMKI